MYITSKQQIQHSFNQAATTYDAHAILQHEVGRRLLDCLVDIKFKPKLILDLAAGTGKTTYNLANFYANSDVIAVDISERMLSNMQDNNRNNISLIQADFDALPFANNSFDLIFTNMGLQWSYDIAQLLQNIYQLLAPNGLFICAIPGNTTLKELQGFWHINDFIDCSVVGDLLLHNQFSDIVTHTETFTLQYKNALDVIRDLQAIGSVALQRHQQNSLRKRHYQQYLTQYEHLRDPITKKLPLTYEIIYIHAWKLPKTAKPRRTEFDIALDAIRRRT